MVLESLSLYNFRNLKKLEVEFSRKVNLLVGDNAQGKTNVIESIYLLATTKSFRTIRDSEMIRWGQEEALVFGKAGPNEIKVVVTKDTKRVFDRKQRIVIWRNDGEKCRACRTKITFEKMEADHVIPHSRGGQTVVENGQALCAPCNKKKATKVK